MGWLGFFFSSATSADAGVVPVARCVVALHVFFFRTLYGGQAFQNGALLSRISLVCACHSCARGHAHTIRISLGFTCFQHGVQDLHGRGATLPTSGMLLFFTGSLRGSGEASRACAYSSKRCNICNVVVSE